MFAQATQLFSNETPSAIMLPSGWCLPTEQDFPSSIPTTRAVKRHNASLKTTRSASVLGRNQTSVSLFRCCITFSSRCSCLYIQEWLAHLSFWQAEIWYSRRRRRRCWHHPLQLFFVLDCVSRLFFHCRFLPFAAKVKQPHVVRTSVCSVYNESWRSVCTYSEWTHLRTSHIPDLSEEFSMFRVSVSMWSCTNGDNRATQTACAQRLCGVTVHERCMKNKTQETSESSLNSVYFHTTAQLASHWKKWVHSVI